MFLLFKIVNYYQKNLRLFCLSWFQGYPPSAPDSRYGGASSVPAAGGFGANDPYSYGKAPPSGEL